jgi:hypothetical protein
MICQDIVDIRTDTGIRYRISLLAPGVVDYRIIEETDSST